MSNAGWYTIDVAIREAVKHMRMGEIVMSERSTPALVAALVVIGGVAQPAPAAPLRQSTVFTSGAQGYHTFRIPAIVQSNEGTLLAFAEGRKNSGSDFGDIDLVMKRSTDGGLTWGPLRVVYDAGPVEAGNPAPVVDRTTGDIVLPFVVDRQRPHVTRSTDGGLTWSTPQDITASAKDPAWDGFSFGPNHSIQLQRGEHAGTLVVPSNHNLAGQNLEPDGREVSLIYSDDGGATWSIGGTLVNPIAGIGPNESSVTELVDGTLYVNARNQGGFSRHRLIGYSEDGGLSFTGQAQFDFELIDPQVQASVVRFSAVDQGDEENRLLFANPASMSDRVRMTVRSSFDEAETWNEGKLIHRGPSAYSDLVRAGPEQAGLLYEHGIHQRYERIQYAAFDRDWLDDPTLLQVDFDEQDSGVAPHQPNGIRDSRGNGLAGTAEGGPEYVAADPRFGQRAALAFDESSDLVRFRDTPSHLLDFEAQDSFTIEAVIQTSAHGEPGVNASGPLVSKDVGPNISSYWLRVEEGKVRFLVADGAGHQPNVRSDVPVNDGGWHHVAAVRDRDSEQLRVYVDYVLAGMTADTTVGGLGNGNDLLIGAFNDGAAGIKQFIGAIDFVRISGEALDPSEFVQPIVKVMGDADGDGDVDAFDLGVWQAQFGMTGEGLSADFDGDGDVDGFDLGVWQNNLGTGVEAAVPEPAGLGAAALGVVTLVRPRADRRVRPKVS